MSMTQTRQHNLPALRFSEFSGEWENTTLGNLMAIKSASRVHKDEWQETGIPFFRSSDVVSSYKGNGNKMAFISNDLFEQLSARSGKVKKGDVLVTGGGSIGIPYLITSDDPLYFKDADLLWFKSSGKVEGFYLYTFFLAPIFRRYVKSISHIGTISHYTIEQARVTPINLPSLTEQQKIASFLSSVDRKIAQLGKKKALLEQYKKGMMQKLFSQELRFKDAQGNDFPDWEEKRLGEISTSNDSGIYKKKELYGKGRNIVGVSDLFKMDSIDGQEFRRVPLSEQELQENSLRAGDILYAESSLVRNGIAKSVYVTKKGAGTAFAWHTRRFSVDGQMANSAYVYYFLESDFARRYIESVATQTALTGITTKDYFKTPLLLPCQLEQEKISSIFLSVDRKIDLVSTELDHAKSFKKGLLQQMFI